MTHNGALALMCSNLIRSHSRKIVFAEFKSRADTHRKKSLSLWCRKISWKSFPHEKFFSPQQQKSLLSKNSFSCDKSFLFNFHPTLTAWNFAKNCSPGKSFSSYFYDFPLVGLRKLIFPTVYTKRWKITANGEEKAKNFFYHQHIGGTGKFPPRGDPITHTIARAWQITASAPLSYGGRM